MNSQSLIAASRPTVLSEIEKKRIKEYVDQAFIELCLLSSDSEPFWKMSMTNRGYVLHSEEYSKRFPKSSYVTKERFRLESSKDSTVVPLKASDLARMFLDMNQWADLFPTIVNKVKILKSLDIGTRGASVHLMYGRMHILSPLVAPREFTFFRHCVQTSPATWFIVDVSCNLRQSTRRTFSWRYPSGVRIESLTDAKSKVTWVEHVNVNGSIGQPLYRDLLSTSHGYGAKRWLYSLKRMSERSLYSRITSSHVYKEGMSILEGRENFKTLSLRMIREFCSVLSMPENLSESSNPNVRMSVRNNNEPGQYRGMIVAASTSIRLPLTFENLFNFLRDENRRPEWDVMHGQTPVNKIAQFSTGPDHGNCISVIQSSVMKEENSCLLQESSIDPVGALVIFTLVMLPKIMEIANGADTSIIPILPCGFLISSDGYPDGNGSDGASGSLLTLAFQWLELDNSEATRNYAADSLNDIVTSSIHCIRAALGCPQLD